MMLNSHAFKTRELRSPSLGSRSPTSQMPRSFLPTPITPPSPLSSNSGHAHPGRVLHSIPARAAMSNRTPSNSETRGFVPPGRPYAATTLTSSSSSSHLKAGAHRPLRPRARTDASEGLKLRENMLSLAPPNLNQHHPHALLAVSRHLEEEEARTHPFASFEAGSSGVGTLGRSPATLLLSPALELPRQGLAALRSGGASPEDLSVDYQSAYAHVGTQAPSPPSMHHKHGKQYQRHRPPPLSLAGNESTRKRVLPVRQELPQGPLPKLPMAPPETIVRGFSSKIFSADGESSSAAGSVPDVVSWKRVHMRHHGLTRPRQVPFAGAMDTDDRDDTGSRDVGFEHFQPDRHGHSADSGDGMEMDRPRSPGPNRQISTRKRVKQHSHWGGHSDDDDDAMFTTPIVGSSQAFSRAASSHAADTTPLPLLPPWSVVPSSQGPSVAAAQRSAPASFSSSLRQQQQASQRRDRDPSSSPSRFGEDPSIAELEPIKRLRITPA
ncbi:hypothetical protein V8E36_009178 [Tilletia maclaganii]